MPPYTNSAFSNQYEIQPYDFGYTYDVTKGIDTIGGIGEGSLNQGLTNVQAPGIGGSLDYSKGADNSIFGDMNYMDMGKLGISAFDAYNKYQANKTNKRLVDAQIGNLAANRAARNQFVSGTQSAFKQA